MLTTRIIILEVIHFDRFHSSVQVCIYIYIIFCAVYLAVSGRIIILHASPRNWCNATWLMVFVWFSACRERERSVSVIPPKKKPTFCVCQAIIGRYGVNCLIKSVNLDFFRLVKLWTGENLGRLNSWRNCFDMIR